MSRTNGPKGLAILAYFTFVGLIIAFIMNLEKKRPLYFLSYQTNVRVNFNAYCFKCN